MSGALSSITSALPSLGKARLMINSADDVVVVATCRTAITKVSCIQPNQEQDLTCIQVKKGGFKDTCPEEMLKAVLAEVLKRGKCDPAAVG